MTNEEAIKILNEMIDYGWLISDIDKCVAIDALEMAIKALKQEPKTGHWISLDDFRGKYNENGFICSECGEHSDFEENFCPNCGAKMIESEEINE